MPPRPTSRMMRKSPSCAGHEMARRIGSQAEGRLRPHDLRPAAWMNSSPERHSIECTRRFRHAGPETRPRPWTARAQCLKVGLERGDHARVVPSENTRDWHDSVTCTLDRFERSLASRRAISLGRPSSVLRFRADRVAVRLGSGVVSRFIGGPPACDVVEPRPGATRS